MEHLFEIKNLSKAFKLNEVKSLAVLNDLNFNLPHVGLFAIYGKSGCGKSTLLNIMQGLMKPTKGEVLFDGKNISRLNERELNHFLNKDVGVVFQGFNLLNNLTIFENLFLATKIKQVDCKEKINALLKKYKIYEMRHKKVSKLSGGERQRVCLIRAIINNPRVIFADEPTGNLDVQNTILVMDELKELSKTCLVIVVSHNKTLVNKYCDGFLDLNNGVQSRYKEIKEVETYVENDQKVKSNKINFIPFALLNNLRNNFWKNLVSFCSVCFSLLIILLSLSFQNGINNNSYKLIEGFQNNNVYKIAKIKYESLNDSNLTLEKTIRPQEDEVKKIFKDIDNVEIKPSIDYFFSEKKEAKIYNQVIDSVTFIPVNTIGDNNIVYVNNAFKEKYEKKFKGSCLNKMLSVSISKDCLLRNVDENTAVTKEKFNLLLRFTIERIKHEFSYLNTPKVYFSYSYFIRNIENKVAREVSKIKGKNITFHDLLQTSDENSEMSGYSSLVFLDNLEDVNKFNNRIKDIKGYKVTNEPYEVVNSFQLLSSSLFNGILFFIVVSCACSISIIGFLSYSSFVANQKQSAIFTILGARNNDIYLVYIIEQVMVALCALVTIFSVFPLLSTKLNSLVFSLTFFKDIFEYNASSSLTIIVAFITLSIVFLFVYLPLMFSKKKEIYKELQEE